MLADTGASGAYEPILDMVRTGRPGARSPTACGSSGHFAHPSEARFDAAMSERTAAFAPSVGACYDFAGLRTVADIGGGQGVLLAAILRAHRHLRGILFEVAGGDRPGRRPARGAGVGDRCEVITGDFFPPSRRGRRLPSGQRAADWDDTRRWRILANCRRAMANRAAGY